MSKIYEALEQVRKDRQSGPGNGKKMSFTPAQDTEEEMTSLHCAIHTLIPKQGGRIVQFIGSSEGEGTSTIAREFAKITAEKIGNTVLLVDVNNDSGPTQHDAFEINTEHDWMESIRNKSAVERIAERIGQTNLSLGLISRDGELTPQLFQTPEFKSLWKSLTAHFDVIVIDSPPVSVSTDGVLLSAHVDGVLLVVEAEKTRWPVVQSTKERIAAAGGNILGIVLNKRKYYIPESIYNRL